jgi:hypothetical protein
LAVTMLVLFASLNAMDGICCPDGCTNEQQSAPQQHKHDCPAGICLLCLDAVSLTVRLELMPRDVVSDRVDLLPPAHHLDAPSDPSNTLRVRSLSHNSTD